jgi:hypothetical protein
MDRLPRVEWHALPRHRTIKGTTGTAPEPKSALIAVRAARNIAAEPTSSARSGLEFFENGQRKTMDRYPA